MARTRDGSYAAGGAKRRKITNSDPELLAYFVGFLREHFDVADETFRVTCNLFADHVTHQREIEDYWLARLDLPRSCLRTSIINVYSKYSKKKRVGKLPYGTCAVVVHRTNIVQAIYGSIQKLGGFERPEWLD